MRLADVLTALTPIRTVLATAQSTLVNTRLILQELRKMNATVTDELAIIKGDIDTLKTSVAQVAAASTANTAALAAALASAKDAGLTDDQLAGFTSVHNDLVASNAALQAIVTPAAPAGGDTVEAPASGDETLGGGAGNDQLDSGAA